MTDELQAALVAMVQSGQQEIPAVLQEVLLREWMWTRFALAALAVLLGIGVLSLIYGASKDEPDCVNAGIFAAVVSVLLSLIPLYRMVELHIAPKAFLLDYVARLLR